MKHTGGALVLVIIITSLFLAVAAIYIDAVYINARAVESNYRYMFEHENEVELLEYISVANLIKYADDTVNKFSISDIKKTKELTKREMEYAMIDIHEISKVNVQLIDIPEYDDFLDVYIRYKFINKYRGYMYCNLLYKFEKKGVKLVDIRLQKEPMWGDLN